MSCLYACVCGGLCYSCRIRKPEEYVGHAEDLYDELYKHSQKAPEYPMAPEYPEPEYKEGV
jgi:hypothetical protein